MTRLAQITDLHMEDFLASNHGIDSKSSVSAVLDRVVERGISEIVLTGDLGDPRSHRWLFDQIRGRQLQFSVILGNHDERSDFEGFDFIRPLLKPDGLYFSKAVSGLECFFLDSSAGEVSGRQRDWLEEKLGRSKEDCVIFIHHPVLDCGETTMDRLYPLKNRDGLRNLLSQSERKITIFCGHYHNEYETVEGTVRQYVAPSAAIQIKGHSDEIEVESREIAFRELCIDKESVKSRVIRISV
jgi:3',5'-cyclic-AMP phosphodiesterase